jgi:hypothetical protein
MHIDKSEKKWKVFIDGRQLGRKEEFGVVCELCKKTFRTTTSRMEIKQSPYKCKHCVRIGRRPHNALSEKQLGHIDKENYRAYDIDGNPIAIKRKVAIECVKCGDKYKNSMGFEKKKSYSWHCRSCSRIKDYESSDYRPNRSNEAKKMWESQTYRSKQRIRPNSPYSKGGYHNEIWFRSQLEIKYAKAFERHGIEYEYEPIRFELDNGEGYIIDFYLPSLNIFVEIKGRYADETDKYFRWKSSGGKFVNSLILFDNALNRFIRSKNGSNFIEEECRHQTSI